MNYENYFEELFESFEDYRKIVLLMFLIQNDKNLVHEIGFSAHDVNRLNLEFKYILIEQHEEDLDHIKNEKVSVIEKILNR